MLGIFVAWKKLKRLKKVRLYKRKRGISAVPPLLAERNTTNTLRILTDCPKKQFTAYNKEMWKIQPAILTGSEEEARAQLAQIQTELGEEVESIQIDVIDGVFADNFTLAPGDWVDFDFNKKKIDWHLMVSDGLDIIWEILDNKATLPTRSVVTQIERLGVPVDYYLDLVQKQEIKAGLSFDLYTPLEEIESQWFNEGLKIIQLMGVEAGESGQKYNELTYKKLQELAEILEKNNVEMNEIEVMIDGGLTPEIIEQVRALDLPFENMTFNVTSGLWRTGKSVAENFAEYEAKLD